MEGEGFFLERFFYVFFGGPPRNFEDHVGVGLDHAVFEADGIGELVQHGQVEDADDESNGEQKSYYAWWREEEGRGMDCHSGRLEEGGGQEGDGLSVVLEGGRRRRGMDCQWSGERGFVNRSRGLLCL